MQPSRRSVNLAKNPHYTQSDQADEIARHISTLAGLKRFTSAGIEKHFIAPPSSKHREEMRQQLASFVEVLPALPIELMR